MVRKTTKELLAESFQELAELKPINKITITNITDNCGMTQPTFYRHFKDKYDMMSWIYVTDIQRITDRIGRNGYLWRDALRDTMQYFAERKQFVLNAIRHTSGRETFLSLMEAANIDLTYIEVRKKLMTEKIPEDLLVFIRFYCCGVTHYICDWLLNDLPITQEQAANLMENCLPEPLRPYLYP